MTQPYTRHPNILSPRPLRHSLRQSHATSLFKHLNYIYVIRSSSLLNRLHPLKTNKKQTKKTKQKQTTTTHNNNNPTTTTQQHTNKPKTTTTKQTNKLSLYVLFFSNFHPNVIYFNSFRRGDIFKMFFLNYYVNTILLTPNN